MTASTDPRPRETASYDAPRTPRSLVRNRVQPAIGEGAAPRDAPCREQEALRGAMRADRVERVGRAGRVEPAPADHQLPESHPVQRYEAHQDPPDRRRQEPGCLPDQRISPASVNSVRISSISSGAFEPPKGPRATRTRSKPSETSGHNARHASRSRRRARLRATAPPTRFPVTQAARDWPGLGEAYSITRSDLCGVPSRRARRIAGESIPRRRAWRVPSCACDPGSPAPRGYASWNGSRESSSDDGCWADKCAS